MRIFIIISFYVCLFQPMYASNCRYEVTSNGQYGLGYFTVGRKNQSFEGVARVALFSGAIILANSGNFQNNHNNHHNFNPNSNPNFTYNFNGKLIPVPEFEHSHNNHSQKQLVFYEASSKKIHVIGSLNTIDDFKKACEEVWKERIAAGHVNDLDYAAHVAQCFEFYDFPKFTEYAFSVSGFCEAAIELYHENSNSNETFKNLAQTIIARQPELYLRMKKKVWREQLGEKLKQFYRTTTKHEYHERRIEVLRRIDQLKIAFEDSVHIQKICHASTCAIGVSEEYNKIGNPLESQKSLNCSIILVSLGESIAQNNTIEIAKDSDRLVCFFLTHIHEFLESEYPFPKTYDYVVKELKYGLPSSNEIKDKIKRADFLVYTAFWNDDPRKPLKPHWNLQDSVKKLIKISTHISDSIDKAYLGAREIVNKGGYYSKMNSKKDRKRVDSERVSNYREILQVYRAHNLQVESFHNKLVSYGYKIVSLLEKGNQSGDNDSIRVYKYRIDAVIKTLQRPDKKDTVLYNLQVESFHSKKFTGTPIQQCLHREILQTIQNGIYLDTSINRPEVGALTDISSTAATLAFECNKMNECFVASGFIDFARGMVDVAREISKLGGLKGAAKGLPIYIANFSTKLGRTSLFIGKKIMFGFGQGALDVKGIFNSALKDYMQSDVLREDILGDPSSPLEFLNRNEKLFEMRRERIKKTWNNFWEKRKHLSLREKVGNTVELLSRAVFDVAAICVALKGAAITSNAIYAASASSGGILAAKEFLQPLVLKATAGGAVAVEQAIPSVSAVWQSITVAFGRAIPFLLGLVEPIAHLCSGMNGGGGGENGMVWNYITPTQGCYDGMKLPKSFIIKVGDRKFWVHGNATDHMYDQLKNKIKPDLESQALLTDFRNGSGKPRFLKAVMKATICFG